MKYGVLSYTTNNIGDEIQSLAAIQYLPHIDTFINRENLNTANIKDNTKLILNGWFMQNAMNWPPHELIHPLFISFHITHKNNSLEYFKQKKHINYLKKHEPIGCRDQWTLRFLQTLGIKSYFSGCLTLTLKNEFDYRTDKILFVDAFHHIPKKDERSFALSIIPKKLKSKIEIVSHWKNKLPNDPIQRLAFAKKLLQKYATAKLVITSRIHCALPCLAFGTPVYFVDIGYNTPFKRNRFEGLLSHMDTLSNNGLLLPQKRLMKHFLSLFPINNLLFKKKISPRIKWEKEKNELVSIEHIKEVLSSTVKSFVKEKNA